MWGPSKPIKGFRDGYISRFVPVDPEAYKRAFESGNWEELNRLPVNIVEAYHGDLPKIHFSGNTTVKCLEVAVSSTLSEDEALLHKLYQSSIYNS